MQGLNENRDYFKVPRHDYPSGDANRRRNMDLDKMIDDWGNNVNVKFVNQDSTIGVVGIQERQNPMDAGRGEWKAIVQASLTPTHSDLTFA
jgi:hypothetical protein